VRRLAPHSRLLAGALVLAACLIAPTGTLRGVAFIGLAGAGWIAACGLPRRATTSYVLLGLTIFLPYFLLAPLLLDGPAPAGVAGRWLHALAVPWDVLVHGLAGILVTAATISALTVSELRAGLDALPVPRLVAAIVLQIVHQSAALAGETGRVAAAVAVRGAAGRGLSALPVLAALPRVWLPRIIERADRIAAAMELRGFAETDLQSDTIPTSAADRAVLAALAAVVAVAGALRWGGGA
jgi:energy-coupling factor transporter transmembrane protein EcfT